MVLLLYGGFKIFCNLFKSTYLKNTNIIILPEFTFYTSVTNLKLMVQNSIFHAIMFCTIERFLIAQFRCCGK